MLSNDDVKKICNEYAYSGITIKELAKRYHCSSTTVSNKIHTAIETGLIPLDTAKRIRAKAIYNANTKIAQKGYSYSDKIEKMYDTLIQKGYYSYDVDDEIHEREEKLKMLRYNLSYFNEVFSDGDDVSYEDISKRAKKLEEEIEELNNLKNGDSDKER